MIPSHHLILQRKEALQQALTLITPPAYSGEMLDTNPSDPQKPIITTNSELI